MLWHVLSPRRKRCQIRYATCTFYYPGRFCHHVVTNCATRFIRCLFCHPFTSNTIICLFSTLDVCVCVWVCLCVYVHACVCVHVCVCACVCCVIPMSIDKIVNWLRTDGCLLSMTIIWLKTLGCLHGVLCGNSYCHFSLRGCAPMSLTDQVQTWWEYSWNACADFDI